MAVKQYSSLNELYEAYKDIELGKIKLIDNNIIWKINDEIVINIDQIKYTMNAAIEDKYLVKLLKDDKFFYKDEPTKYYSDIETLIKRFIKGENNSYNYVKKYCMNLYNKKKKFNIIISVIVIVVILMICYSILFR